MSDTVYSTYQDTGCWSGFKRWARGKERTEPMFWDFAEQSLDRVRRTDGQSAAAGAVAQLLCAFVWRFRRIDHYFLAPGIAEFCVSSVKEFSEAYSQRLPATPEDPLAGNPLEYSSSGAFAVHFPTSERPFSLVVIPSIGGVAGTWTMYFAATDKCSSVVMDRSASEEWVNAQEAGSDGAWISKLVFGLSLYMDAFPDAVVPSDEMPRSASAVRFKGRLHRVRATDIVKSELEGSRAPHWRVGHWRILRSEKFVRKQGQTVWVKGAHVKGRAFNVLDDTPQMSHA